MLQIIPGGPMTASTLFRVSCMSLFAAAAVGASTADETAAPSAVKPTIVLVHGAFEDASAWQQVIAVLQRDEYEVVAVQTPLTSLAADAQATKRAVEALNGPVVMAGHSWGGAVITEAAAGDERVKALVYIAAFAPDANEVVTAYGDKYPTRLGAALKPDSAGFLTVDPAQFQDLFARDVPAAQAHVAAATQKPMLGSAFGDSVVRAGWRSVPTWYVITLEDQAIQPDLQRFYAERMKAKMTEIQASHAVIASQPAKVARVIEEAARASMQGKL
jgi:pimeloyl-ACP methyl ester carboxylesterase